MTYVAWAALYEGGTDAAYFDVLIPRVMEDIILNYGVRHSDIAEFPTVRLKRDPIDAVATEACSRREGFHLVFFHADIGGRGQADNQQIHASSFCRAMHQLCDWPKERCIPVLPRPETEAWALADPIAVTTALGYRGSPESVGLPANAAESERVRDPKAILGAAVAQVRGRRRSVDAEQLLPAIALRQRLRWLRDAPSFVQFEGQLKAALAHLGCI